MVAVGYADGDKRIDFIRDVNGVSPDTVRQKAVVIDLLGEPIRVVDPVTLFAAKAANVVGLNQDGRNDIQQFRVMGCILPCYLRTYVERLRLTDGGGSQCGAIKLYKSVAGMIRESRVALALEVAGIDPRGLLPTEGLSDFPKLERFVSESLDRSF